MTTDIGSLFAICPLDEIRLDRVSCPARTLKNDTEPSSVFTIATSVSSGEMSIGVERLGLGSSAALTTGFLSQLQDELQSSSAAHPLFGPPPRHVGASGMHPVCGGLMPASAGGMSVPASVGVSS